MICFLFASLLVAQTQMTTAEVLDRVRVAYGALDPSRAYREVLINQDGDVRSSRIVDRHGRDYLAIDTVGELKTADGRLGGQGWYQDANGVVFLSSGVHDIDEKIVGSVGGGAIESSAPARIDHDDYLVERKRPDGLTIRYYYNAGTFLLDRSETVHRDGTSSTSEYSDYRKVGGATVAFARSWHDSIGNNGKTFVRSYEEIPLANARIGLPENAQTFSTPLNTAFDLDVTFTHDYHIVVPVTIQGHRMDFILDSGATGMTIDPGAAHQAGLDVTNRTRGSIAGAIDIAQAVADDVSIGGMNAKRVAFDVLPIGQHYDYAKVVGLIGSDFFASNILRIDYPGKKVTVFPGKTFDEKTAGAPLRVQLDDGVIRVPTWFDGHRANLVLDTGSFATFLDNQFGTSIGFARNSSYNGGVTVSFLGGEVESGWYDTKNIIFADTEFKTGRILVAKQQSGAIWDGYDGLLGPDIFSAFAITFDYNNSVIYVK
jgi:hypothetical protein